MQNGLFGKKKIAETGKGGHQQLENSEISFVAKKKKGDGRIDICSLCLVYLLSLPVSSYAPMVMGV